MGSLDPAPSGVRWRILALLLAYSFLTWFNRVSMSAAADERIMKQYEIPPEQMGVVYSAFLLVYAAFMTPGGWFIDRFGPRIALIVMGFGSALFGALTGSAVLVGAGLILPALMVIRGLMGLLSAPVYPSTGKIVSRWFPYPQRAFMNGLVTGAAPLGIACTYIVFGWLIDRVDWPGAFAITGGITALVAVLWAIDGTNRPAEHRGVNAAELQLIGQHEPEWSVEKTTEPDGGWQTLLQNRSLVLLTVSYIAVNYFEYLFSFWAHFYFHDQLHMGTAESRYYAGVVKLAEAGGMVLGGWLSDRLTRAYGYRYGRAIVPIYGMCLSAVFLLVGLLSTELGMVVFWFALAVGSVGMCEGPFWTTAIELGGRRGATSAAICNTGGNAGGLIAPVVTPLVGGLLGWHYGVGLGGVICLVGAALWWWIDPSERCDEKAAA